MIRRPGGVLDQVEIVRRGVIIGISEACLRPAGYDLRVGNKLLDPDGQPVTLASSGQRAHLLLKPGESAIIRTKEEIALPADIAANVTLKTGVAANGVLLLSGMLVDPTYRGPLHLLIANLGSRSFVVNRGDPIAAVQFLQVAGHPNVDAGQAEEPPHSSLSALFDDPSKREPPVAFLEDLRALRDGYVQLSQDTERTSQRAELVVNLGLFLITATLLGVVLDFGLSFALNRKLVASIRHAVPQSTSGTVLAALVLVFLTAVAGGISYVAGQLISKRSPGLFNPLAISRRSSDNDRL